MDISGLSNFNPVLLEMQNNNNATSSFGSLAVINNQYAVSPPDLYGYSNYGVGTMLSNGIDGAGVTLALIGGPEAGYLSSDVNYFWNYYNVGYYNSNGIWTYPVSHEMVIGGGGSPGLNGISSTEETLDIEWAGVTAPAATIDEVIYNAPWYEPWNDGFEHGFLQELSYVVGTLKPEVMSTSFGYYNNYVYSTWPNDLNTIHSDIVQAVDEGITVVAASGDDGFSCSGQISVVGLDPYAISVGGVSDYLNDFGITGETGWSYSSGGYATYDTNLYSQPSYQTSDSQVPHNGYRDTPDLSFVAAPYIATYYNGHFDIYCGTSYAAPMFAGIIAGMCQFGGNLQFGYGFVNPGIYEIPYSTGAYNDVTTGNNGMPAGTGWDYVTGIGSVNAWTFVKQLQNIYFS